MTTERMLRKWRKEALMDGPKLIGLAVKVDDNVTTSMTVISELNKRILQLTQELLDQHLLRRGK